MNQPLRAVRLAALSLLAAAVPSAAAVVEALPRVLPGLGGTSAAPAAAVGAMLGAPAAFNAVSAFTPLTAPSAFAAPAAAQPAAALAAPALSAAPAASILPVGPAAVAPAAAPAVDAPERAGAPALDTLKNAAASRGDSRRGGDYGRQSFDGGRAPAPAATFVVNDEGINIEGRAAVYYQEVRRMVDLYQGKLNLSESLDVMDDAYGDVLAKVSAVEAIAKGRGLKQENTHLEETLVWVDGVLDDGAKKVAVHTHRVFFHHAKNPQSEIREGNRRVDGVIRDAEEMFRRGGKAEAALGKLDEVELVFDARGYSEIKEHIRQVGAQVTERTGGRITFKFLDDIAPMPKEISVIRAKVNELAKKYQGQGLSKIVEGVVYSRYVGLLLELKTLEHYYKKGYKILQSGRELFDAEGHYISELDAVVESPEGKVLLVEAKSARVGLPNDEVLRDKVLYKLDTYRKFKPQLDAMIGKPFDQVVFAMDIALDPDAGVSGRLTDRDQRKLELADYLRSREATLSAKYGWPVSFLFLQSGPADGGGKQGFRPGAATQGGRKHGKNGKRR